MKEIKTLVLLARVKQVLITSGSGPPSYLWLLFSATTSSFLPTFSAVAATSVFPAFQLA